MNYPIVGGRPYLYEQILHRKPLAGRLNFPNNHASRKAWAALQEASDTTETDPQVFLRQRLMKTQSGACADVESGCVHGLLQRLPQEGSCRCQFGVRYLVLHSDDLARPDMHSGLALWASEALPTLAESSELKVLQLW